MYIKWIIVVKFLLTSSSSLAVLVLEDRKQLQLTVKGIYIFTLQLKVPFSPKVPPGVRQFFVSKPIIVY